MFPLFSPSLYLWHVSCFIFDSPCLVCRVYGFDSLVSFGLICPSRVSHLSPIPWLLQHKACVFLALCCVVPSCLAVCSACLPAFVFWLYFAVLNSGDQKAKYLSGASEFVMLSCSLPVQCQQSFSCPIQLCHLCRQHNKEIKLKIKIYSKALIWPWF